MSNGNANQRYLFAPAAAAELAEIHKLKNKELARVETSPFANFIDKLPAAFARVALAFHFIAWYSNEIHDLLGDGPPVSFHGDRTSSSFVLDRVYSPPRSSDYATVLPLFRLLADQGNAQGQYSLGFIYSTGEGVKQDYEMRVRDAFHAVLDHLSLKLIGKHVLHQRR